MINKKLILLSLIASASIYGADIQLGQSVISATGFETAQKDTVKNVAVITSKEIEEKNYQSVTDVLKDIPSINIIGDSREPIIDMRGQGSKANSNVQVLVDGVGINLLDNSHAKTPINTIPVENIEKIEVIPGGGAILYGSGTRGGIVNIITKSGAGITGGSLGAEYTSFGGKKGDINYGTSFGNTDINVGYTRNEYRGYRDEDKADSDYFEGILKHQISDNKKITFKYSRFEEEGTKPDSLTKDKLDDREQSGLLLGEYNKLNIKKDEFNLKYEEKISENLDFNIIGFYQNVDYILDQKIGNDLGNGNIFFMTSKMDVEDEKLGVKPKLRLKYRENDEIILGYDYIKNDLVRNSSVGKSKYLNDFTKETHSVFLLNKNRVNNFEFTQGIRYEYADYSIYRKEGTGNPISDDKNMDNFAYELVGNYFYSDTGNIYGKLERGFTSPAPSQLSNKINGAYVGNNLESETYLTYEIGGKDYVLGSLISGAIYLTDTKDEITTEMTKTNITAMQDIYNKNIGKTRRYGLELSAEQYLGKFTFREGYSYVKTEILEDSDKKIEGNEIANVPQHKFSLGVDYQFNEKLILSSTTVYSSKYYLNNENSGGKQNSHTVTNLTINYYPIPALRLYTGINNLFNEKYYTSIDSTGVEFDPAAERNFVFGFKYNF